MPCFNSFGWLVDLLALDAWSPPGRAAAAPDLHCIGGIPAVSPPE
jgi:hypothetical protein